MLNVITALPKKRFVGHPAIAAHGHDLAANPAKGEALLVEPLFHDFRTAGDNELGYPFVAIGNLAEHYDRMTVAVTYSVANAQVYKGYLQDLCEALKPAYPSVEVRHVPFVTCGVPLLGSVLMVTGSKAPFKPVSAKDAVMPSDYFEGLLSHVPRNRPNFQIGVSSRSIGAVRSDLQLLPPLSAWKGRSLMVEYRKGKTTANERMKSTHVGRLFGIEPCAYTDALSLCLPAGVVEAYI